MMSYWVCVPVTRRYFVSSYGMVGRRDVDTGITTTVAGPCTPYACPTLAYSDGFGTNAMFGDNYYGATVGIVYDTANNQLFVLDNRRIFAVGLVRERALKRHTFVP